MILILLLSKGSIHYYITFDTDKEEAYSVKWTPFSVFLSKSVVSEKTYSMTIKQMNEEVNKLQYSSNKNPDYINFQIIGDWNRFDKLSRVFG